MSREALKAEDFNYDLKENQIAKYPLSNRNNSKLLTYKNGSISEDQFFNLNKYLPDNSLLVFNDTKVIAARMFFRKKTGAKLEVFCLEPFESTIEQTLTATKSCVWTCIVGNLKKWKNEEELELQIDDILLKANIIEKKGREVVLKFNWDKGVIFSSILDKVGQIPLPPYLNRNTEKEDKENYQTVYANKSGAVAAPTAGLHFVKGQLTDLQQDGHDLVYLTLFVGAGTFRPVTTEKLVNHSMHQERIVIDKTTILKFADAKRKIISVGTTSLRSLESLYWLAVKIHQTNNKNERFISQEDAYNLNNEWSFSEACSFILNVLEKTNKSTIDFHSSLFIMPGYQFKSIKGLITNFHQPKSTLLALVAALIGDNWKKVYNYALNNKFRFLSYGDSSILLKE